MIEVIIVVLLAFIGYQLYQRNRFTEIDRYLEKEAPNLFHKMPKELREFYTGVWQAGVHLMVTRNVEDTVKKINRETTSNVFRFHQLESREIVRILREEKGATEFEINYIYWCYWSGRDQEAGIFWRTANGTGQAERLTTSQANQYPEFFSSDETLIFRDNSRGNWDLWTLSMESQPTPQPLLQTEFSEASSALSPDGRRIAYVSDETGRNEVYVRPFPNTGDNKIPISRDGGDEPLWGPDGRELFFHNELDDGSIEVMSVTVTGEPTFSAGEPEVLFTGEFYTGGFPNWDISSDGQRFLMMKLAEQPEQRFEDTQLVVVENWFEELNRLAPPSP